MRNEIGQCCVCHESKLMHLTADRITIQQFVEKRTNKKKEEEIVAVGTSQEPREHVVRLGE